MTTIQVTLTEELKAVVEREVAEGGFESPDAYLQSLVRDAERRREERELDAKLLEALDVEEPGDSEHMASLAVAVEEMKAGKGRPIEAMFAEMENRLAAAKAKRPG